MERQPKRIIIEGMDGAGKSTLIKDLSKEFPHLQIVTRPQGVHFDNWWPQELDRLASDPIPIYDRFFYSELVYGPIIRHAINADMGLVNNVAWFMRLTALLIYVRPNSQIIRDRVHKSPQMEGVIEHFPQLLEAYDGLMTGELQWYGNRFYHYDWNADRALAAVSDTVRSYLGAT